MQFSKNITEKNIALKSENVDRPRALTSNELAGCTDVICVVAMSARARCEWDSRAGHVGGLRRIHGNRTKNSLHVTFGTHLYEATITQPTSFFLIHAEKKV